MHTTLNPSQTERIKELFTSHPNEWIPLYDIFIIAKQYNARIHELRREGMIIYNKTKEINGSKHSWYMYVVEPNIQKEFF